VPYISHRILLTVLRARTQVELAGLALRQEKVVAERMKIFQRFWYDTALSSTPAAFPSLLSVADPDRILFGSDFPFAPVARRQVHAQRVRGHAPSAQPARRHRPTQRRDPLAPTQGEQMEHQPAPGTRRLTRSYGRFEG